MFFICLPNTFHFFDREYLATFKKTVAMHEVFLCRLAAHPKLRKDENFKVFLEYKQEVWYKGYCLLLYNTYIEVHRASYQVGHSLNPPTLGGINFPKKD